jgi:TonB family protein
MQRERFFSVLLEENRRCFLIVCALLLLCLSDSALAQSGRNRVKKKSPPPPVPVETKIETEPQAERADEDKVYSSKEVDVKARFTNRVTKLPSAHKRGCPVNGHVLVRVVLHKSGKITEATVIKGLGCSYDKDAAEAVRQLKFIPAMKDGQPVSQYVTIEFDYKKLF